MRVLSLEFWASGLWDLFRAALSASLDAAPGGRDAVYNSGLGCQSGVFLLFLPGYSRNSLDGTREKEEAPLRSGAHKAPARTLRTCALAANVGFVIGIYLYLRRRFDYGGQSDYNCRSCCDVRLTSSNLALRTQAERPLPS
jgi:hypothetical protein